MANQTVSVSRNLDDAAIAGLLNGEDITVDSGAELTIDADNRHSQQAAVIGNITISSVTGGRLFMDGTKVWEIPFSASSGNVPALGTLGTLNCTGGTSGAQGEFLGVWATGALAPTAAASAMPASGFVKFRQKSGTFSAGETVTLPGGATITAGTAGKRSWINVVGEYQQSVTVPRLGRWDIYGEWYELGTTNGADDQQFPISFPDTVPAVQVETAAGSGVYEWYLNAGARWNSATQYVPTDARGKFFGQWKAIVNAGTTSGSPTVTTTDTTGLAVGMPVIASAGFANLSGLYIVSINPGVSFTVNTNANATSGTVTIRSPLPYLEFARRASNSCGFKPATGCKVRVPNVILSTSISGFAGNVLPQTLADRWETVTTSAGVIDWGGVVCNAYLNASAPYSVFCGGVAFDTAAVLANVASSTTFDDCAVGHSGALENTALSFSSLFSGLTLNKVRASRYAAGAPGNVSVVVQDCADVEAVDCQFEMFGSTSAVTRGNADVRAVNFLRCVDVAVTRLSAIGGRVYVEQCVRVDFLDTRFADQLNGTTVNTNPLVGAFHVLNTSAEVMIDGFSNFAGIANVHTYTAILLTAGSASDVEFRNLGTAAAPYDCGSANATGVLVSASVTLGLALRRLYAQNTRTSPVSLANTVQNVVIDNVWGDAADSQAVAAVVCTARGCRWTNSVTGQTAVYGRHWEDAFTSTTAGRILIACNEPLAATAAQCAITSGNPQFNSAGSVVMPTVGDQVTWEMPYFLRGVTSLANVAPTLTGTNTGNFTLEFQADTGSGYGSWLALTGANLSGVGAISPSTGVRLKVRATVATANASNALTYIRMDTVTNATDQRIQYDLPTDAQANVTSIFAGSRIQVYNVTTDTEIANEFVPGTTWALGYNNGGAFSAGDTVRVRLTYYGGATAKSKFETFTVATATGWAALAAQTDCPVYAAYGIDGGTVTEFSWDGTNLEIDINDPDNLWYASRLFAWDKYHTWDDAIGIRDMFDAVRAVDAGNIRLAGVLLDNLSANTAKQADAVRLFRDDDALPVKNPTTGGGGLTFFSTGTIYTISAGSGLSPSQDALLTSIGSRTARIDGLVEDSSGDRFTAKALEAAPTGGGGSSDWTATERQHIRHRLGIDGSAAAPSATPSLALEATVAAKASQASVTALGSPLQVGSYVAPDNVGIAAIKSKTDNLPSDPADASDVASLIDALPTATENATAVRSELATELARIDVAVSTRNAMAPDNASVAAIKAKTDNLPADPADNSEILAAIGGISAGGATLAEIEGSAVLAKEATVAAVKAKTDALPSDPADQSAVEAAIAAIPAAPSAPAVAGAVRTELAVELARLDAAVSSRSEPGDPATIPDDLKKIVGAVNSLQ